MSCHPYRRELLETAVGIYRPGAEIAISAAGERIRLIDATTGDRLR